MQNREEYLENVDTQKLMLLHIEFNPIVSWPSLHNTTMGQTIVSRIYLSSNFGYLRVAHRVAQCCSYARAAQAS